MARIWLPLGKPRQGASERDQIVLRLRELGVHVPGAQSLDISQLREILHWQEERAKSAVVAPEPPRLSREQVKQGLRDYRDFQKARKEGRRRLY